MAHARASGGSRVSALKGRIAFSAGPLEPSRSTVCVYELSTRRPTQSLVPAAVGRAPAVLSLEPARLPSDASTERLPLMLSLDRGPHRELNLER